MHAISLSRLSIAARLSLSGFALLGCSGTDATAPQEPIASTSSDLSGGSLSSISTRRDGFVYVMTNDPEGNSVVQYARARDGGLTRVAEVSTGGLGGTGNGVGALDPLGSEHSLALAGREWGPDSSSRAPFRASGQLLVAVNAGSDQVSALSTTEGGLHLLNTISSGGSFPSSVAIRGDLVYVLNAHGVPNVTGFRLGEGGLAPLAGSSTNLPGGTASAPHDVRFAPGGDRLLVTEGGTNQLDLFDVVGDLPVGVVAVKSAGSGPFGMAFGSGGVLLNAEANSASVSSYRLSRDTLSLITGALGNGQAATCWISVAEGGRLAFVSNTGSGTLSAYRVSRAGTLDLEAAVAATAAGGAPIDSAFSRDGSFLYVDDSALGRVLIYARHGASLALVGTVGGLPTTVQGIAAQ